MSRFWTTIAVNDEERYNWPMTSLKYRYWEDQGQWIGYLEEFPDYLTQGNSFEDLQEHLKGLYADLTSGEIPGVRRMAELKVS